MGLSKEEAEEMMQLEAELKASDAPVPQKNQISLPDHKYETSALGSAILGGSQGATLGYADEMFAGAGALYDKAGAELGTRGDISLEDAYKTRKKNAEGLYRAAADQHPVANFAGTVTGGIGAAALAPALAPSSFGGAATVGAISGFGSNPGIAADDPTGAALSTGFGAAGGMAGKAIGDKVGNLYKGLKQKAKDKAMDALFAQNQAGLNKIKLQKDGYEKVSDAITSSEYGKPIVSGIRRGDQMEAPIQNRLSEVNNNISKAIADADAMNLSSVSGKRIGDRINSLKVNQIDDPNLVGLQQKLSNTVNSFKNKGEMTLAEAQYLKNEVYKYSLSNPATTAIGAKATNKINQILADEIRGAAERGSQMTGKGLEDVGENLANFGKHQDVSTGLQHAVKAAGKKEVQNTANRSASITDYMSALAAGATAVGIAGANGASAPGMTAAALLGIPVLVAHKFLRQRGNTIASQTYMALSKALDNQGISAKYMPILQAAARKGPESLVIMVNNLRQKDPEFESQLNSGDQGQ